MQLVAPGIYQLRIPLPFALDHVYCYALEDNDGWTLIDTGLNRPEAQDIWRAALGDDLARVRRIILTHAHPDHYGMAGWLQAISGAPVYLSPREMKFAQAAWVNADEKYERLREHTARMGAPDTVIAQVIDGLHSTRLLTYPHPELVEPLIPGVPLTIGARSFRLIYAPGHADGQVLLYCEAERLILSGDHVLMPITPNIGLWAESDPYPLGRYLLSLKRLRDLPVELALPGHKRTITDWSGRIDQLIAHHDQRLMQTKAALASGDTAFEVAGVLFDFTRLSAHEVRFALMETLAHLEVLVVRGAISLSDDAVWRFHVVD